jgi:hypothetical protein
MKINEIAINEGIEKLGKYVFNTAKNAWELANDTKALSKGGVKSADNLVSPAELSALRRDPVPPSSGPAVWRKRGDPNFDTTPGTLQGPSTGGTIPKPIVPAPKPRANTSAYDQEVLNRHDMNPRMPNKGKPSAEADAFAAEKAAQAERTAVEKQAAADDLARQVSPGADPPMTSGGQADPEMIAEPLPSWLSPKGAKGSKTTGGRQEPSINRPADDLAKQIKPGADAPKTTGSQQSSGGPGPTPPGPGMGPPVSGENKFSIDDVERIVRMGRSTPAAAQAAEKEVAKKSGMGPWSKAAAGGLGATIAYELGTGAYNKFKPEAWPAAPGAPQGSLNLDTPPVTPPPQDWKPSGVTNQPSAAPAASTNDPTEEELQKAREADPEWQELHKKDKVNESTNELNRMVYLSRL